MTNEITQTPETERKIRVPPIEKEIEDKLKAASTDKVAREVLTKQLKALRFDRVMRLRLDRLRNEFELVGRLFDSPNYSYSMEQAENIMELIDNWYTMYVTSKIITNDEEKEEIVF